ncbi:MAG: radical SAM protein, partial [Methylococcales bacterium]|nr:radical SAM protein [Methylococcales bacterium]
IRITGGEPLIRKGALGLLEKIVQIESLDEVVLTTNGSHLAEMAGGLKAAGVKRINISLDTLNAAKFKQITRTGDLEQVLKGIHTAKALGFEKIKLNAVILKQRNHDEVGALVQFAIDNELDISFIEEMPLGQVSEHSRSESYYPSHLIRQDLAEKFTLVASTQKTGGPSAYFKVAGTQSKVGFISPHSDNFCSTCNRVRLTVDGHLLLCLGNEHSVDLKRVIRAFPGDAERLKQAIVQAMQLKPEKHEFNIHEQPVIFRHMSVTGG